MAGLFLTGFSVVGGGLAAGDTSLLRVSANKRPVGGLGGQLLLPALPESLSGAAAAAAMNTEGEKVTEPEETDRQGEVVPEAVDVSGEIARSGGGKTARRPRENPASPTMPVDTEIAETTFALGALVIDDAHDDMEED